MTAGAYVVPYVRRRNTPAQRDALDRLFAATPHPTRAQRHSLAIDTGMQVPSPSLVWLSPDPIADRELKSVTNWFQNRRQASRRKSLSANENNPPKARLPHSHPQARSKTPLDRSKVSLDRIAALSERPCVTSQLDSARLPLTPRKDNAQQKSPSELWTHMLSSPVVPPPSPEPEEARLAVLSSRTAMRYPMEWACLKARQKNWADEEADVLRRSQEEEVDMDGRNALFSLRPQFEDVEAAITLLGFKTRS